MRHKGFQVGLLFNHLPEIVFFATNLFSSDTDLLVKMSRKIKKDENITRDHQIFRNAAKKELSPEDLATYFSHDIPNFIEQFNVLKDYDFDLKCLGSWFILLSQIKGFKLSLNSKDVDISNYLMFLEELCLLEYNFIKSNEGKNDFYKVNTFLTTWLSCAPFESNEPKLETWAKYMICLVMHWAALFEKLLEIECCEAEKVYNSILIKSLPKIKICNKGKTPLFYLTTEQFITRIKDKRSEQFKSDKKYKWIDFHRDIARAQLLDAHLNPDALSEDDTRLLNPDTTAIKKQISRWFNGSRLSIEHVKKYFLIFEQSYDPKEMDFSLLSIEFINIFSYIQIELFKAGVPPEVIVKEFSRYSDYKDLVNKRYESYQNSNTLIP